MTSMLCCGMSAAAATAAHRTTTTGSAADNNISGVQRILGSIETLRTRVDGKEHDIEFLTGLLKSSQLQSIIRMHESVESPEGSDSTPLCTDLQQIANELVGQLHSVLSPCSRVVELLEILRCPHLQAFMSAHDRVAVKDFAPLLSEIPYEVDEDDDLAVKIIRLIKNPTEPLGVTLQVDSATGSVYIARVLHGGAADRCGLICSGDEVREVNGVNVLGKQPDEVIRIMSSAVGTLTLTLIPNTTDSSICTECKMRVRAQFSYDPADDRSMPCHEAGLAFHRGDILEIVSQDDSLWWQARKDGDKNHSRAGLIPSRLLQERREAAKLTNITTISSDNKENKGQKSLAKSSPKLNKKIKKSKKPSTSQQIADVVEKDLSEELISYEEVERLFPKPGQFRPVILIGAAGVGRSDLKRRLVATRPEHYQEPVPFTTRPIRPGEVDGEEYFFVSRANMENDIQNKRFVEHGEYNGNLYGTTFDQVKSIINSGHVCLMCPNPKALRALRCAQLKPYIIFIRPATSLEQLMTSRANASRHFTDEELKEMLTSSVKIESVYGHWVDATIVNDDIDAAFSELCNITSTVDTQPHWVPSTWITSS